MAVVLVYTVVFTRLCLYDKTMRMSEYCAYAAAGLALICVDFWLGFWYLSLVIGGPMLLEYFE